MAENSAISWTDHTFNPWYGCQENGPGCDNCYARLLMEKRFHKVRWGPGEERIRTSDATWEMPGKWNRYHDVFYRKHGRRQRVFCLSLGDWADNGAPNEWRRDLAKVIVDTPNLDYLMLTKRVGNAAAMLAAMFPDGTPDHVLVGATMVHQKEVERDLPKLLAVPARRRFLSLEPLLGTIDFYAASAAWQARGYTPWLNTPILHGIHQVIVGGESSAKARPMDPEWARSLRDQCAAAGVPFHFKQWGEWLGAGQDGDHEARVIELNATDGPVKVGPKAAGRMLDGRTHDGFPEALV